MSQASEQAENRVRPLRVFGREMPMPQSRPLRILIGVFLIFFGCLGFLPILGFWMIPLGLLVLSYEFATVRRWRRRTAVWWHRRRRGKERRPSHGLEKQAAERMAKRTA